MVNLQAFPQLGAFPNEVGAAVVPGGIGGPWPMNLPLNYWWNYGKRSHKRKFSRPKRVKKFSRSRRFSMHLGNPDYDRFEELYAGRIHHRVKKYKRSKKHYNHY